MMFHVLGSTCSELLRSGASLLCTAWRRSPWQPKTLWKKWFICDSPSDSPHSPMKFRWISSGQDKQHKQLRCNCTTNGTRPGASWRLNFVSHVSPVAESIEPRPNQPQAITCSKSIMPVIMITKLNRTEATCGEKWWEMANSQEKNLETWPASQTCPAEKQQNVWAFQVSQHGEASDRDSGGWMRAMWYLMRVSAASYSWYLQAILHMKRGAYYLSVFLPVCLSIDISIYCIYLSIFLSFYLSTLTILPYLTLPDLIYQFETSATHSPHVLTLQCRTTQNKGLKSRKMRVLARLASVELVENLGTRKTSWLMKAANYMLTTSDLLLFLELAELHWTISNYQSCICTSLLVLLSVVHRVLNLVPEAPRSCQWQWQWYPAETKNVSSSLLSSFETSPKRLSLEDFEKKCLP